MALSYNNYTGNGTDTQYPITFNYIRISHIKVIVNSVAVTFTADAVNKRVTLAVAPAVGDVVKVFRFTPRSSAYSDFTRGNAFGQTNVNNSFLWQLYISQEISEGIMSAEFSLLHDMNLSGKNVTNMREATIKGNAVEYNQWDTDKAAQDTRLGALESYLYSGSDINMNGANFDNLRQATKAGEAVEYAQYQAGITNQATIDASQDSRLTQIEQSYVTGGETGSTSWNYTATGGETSVTPPFAFDNVRDVYLNGVHQIRNKAWEWEKSFGQTIKLAEALTANSEVTVRVGGESIQVVAPTEISLNDVFGVPVFALTNGMTISPIQGVYPKLKIQDKIFELENNTLTYTVASFKPVGTEGYELKLSDNNLILAQKVKLNNSKEQGNITSLGETLVCSGETSLMVIGDSITSGNGASTVGSKYVSKFFNSVWNSVDRGLGRDRCYGYESYIEMLNARRDQGITSNGTVVDKGMLGSRLQLNHTQNIGISAREYVYVGFTYEGGANIGNIDVNVNGTVITTITTDKTEGHKRSPLIAVKAGSLTNFTDVVVLVCMNNPLVISSFYTLNSSHYSPFGYVVSRSGFAFQDYVADSNLDEIAFYLKGYREDATKVVVINLGTNNIYSESKSVTPTEYITLLKQLIDGISSRVSNLKVIVGVPPKADTSKWKTLKGAYLTYVNAITDFCISNNYSMNRLDETSLSKYKHGYSGDGLHPNDEGHSVLAAKTCESLNINYKPIRTVTTTKIDTINLLEEITSTSNMFLGTGWTPYIETTKVTATYRANHVVLGGLIRKGSGAGGDLSSFSHSPSMPVGRDVYCTVASNIGSIVIRIAGSIITIVDTTVLPTILWVCLDSVSYYAKL